MTIPQQIHQTWKNEQVPEHLEAYVQSWRDHHPDWHYTLWTDDMNRDFIATHYPSFLPVYDRYPSAIQKVDAVRYFILFQYGGIFVDLDFECLRHTGSLLKDAAFVAGKEPAEHALSHQKEYIISNAFMAAASGAPFLQNICDTLQQNNYYRYANEPGFNVILDCAGPFMLSRAYEQYHNKEEVRILEHDILYPLIKDTTGRLRPEDAHNPALLQNAYAIHHYWGSWWH